MTSKTRRITWLPVVLTLALSGALGAQTRVTAPKNSYTPEQDVQIGREAAQEVRQQLPMLNDGRTENFVEEVGERLVGEIPAEFRQPAFRYSFEVVNLRDINAFALPGGPMFLHRGMIEAARTDAEVAGVMAHEMAHVMLRHGTAQATKARPYQIGSIAGQIFGAIIGGRKGQVISQTTQFGLGAMFLKYGREYERQADLLGAQLMARAGYDPRQMANMFRTIQQQGGGRGPEWLSSHPDPGNRYEAINREAAALRVEGHADTADEFQSARAGLSRMSPAPTMAEVARAQEGAQGRTASTGRAVRVQPPSRQWRTYDAANFLRVSVPANWQPVGGGSTLTYAPEGGYGSAAFTHGIQIGVTQAQGGSSLQEVTDDLLRGFARSNPQLRRQAGYSRANVGGREGLTTTLSNVSDATGETEAVNVSTVRLRDGRVLYMLGVAPAQEAQTYLNTFSRVRQSLQIEDR